MKEGGTIILAIVLKHCPNVYAMKEGGTIILAVVLKHCPNVYAMKEGGTIILAVVLLLPPEHTPCAGDAVSRCESETTLFGLPKEDTTRNQWLSCIYNTVPQILEYVQCILRRTISWTVESPVRYAQKLFL